MKKEHRKFIEFLRSRPESFNFSAFVREALEEKMDEMDWEYEEEESSKPDKLDLRSSKQY